MRTVRKNGRARVRRVALALGLLALAPVAAQAQSQLLVVSGLAGEPRFEKEFASWGTTLVDAAAKKYGLRPEQIVWLADKPAADPQRIDGRSTRAEVERVIREMAQRAGPTDRVLVVLIGHGASDGQGARLNLSGPDLSATDLAKLLDLLPTQRVVVVNTTSSSGDFQQPLAAKNRTVVTATRSGMERNETVFGKYFVASFAGDGADTDKDGKTTILEAFQYSQREVERHYKDANHLQTEHSVLGGDQELARGFYLAAASTAAASGSASAEVRALVQQRQQIEGRIEALRARRATLQAADYEKQMEDLLVELALKNREIRAKEGGQ